MDGVVRLPTTDPRRGSSPGGSETVSAAKNRYGAITSGPARGIDAVRSAAVGAGGVLSVGGPRPRGHRHGGIGTGARAAVRRFTMARWEREGEQVEPVWSGRAR